MKKNNNRKGFTIVELVIVIAVIAILASVLIPTFSGVITKANESKVLQGAKNAYTEVLIEEMADGDIDNGTTTKNGYSFKFENGKLTTVTFNDYIITVDDNGTITSAQKNNG